MALVESSILPLGTPLPTFQLADVVENASISSGDFAGKPVLVMVICNHCPYVKHIKSGLVELGHWLNEEGVSVVAVSANDPNSHPEDGPARMADEARAHGYPFPYLFDEDQKLVHALQARCTPEFYLFSESGDLVYRGQMDDARPGKDEPNDGHCIRDAVAAMKAGQPPLSNQTQSIGCNIKWKPGNEP